MGEGLENWTIRQAIGSEATHDDIEQRSPDAQRSGVADVLRTRLAGLEAQWKQLQQAIDETSNALDRIRAGRSVPSI